MEKWIYTDFVNCIFQLKNLTSSYILLCCLFFISECDTKIVTYLCWLMRSSDHLSCCLFPSPSLSCWVFSHAHTDIETTMTIKSCRCVIGWGRASPEPMSIGDRSEDGKSGKTTWWLNNFDVPVPVHAHEHKGADEGMGTCLAYRTDRSVSKRLVRDTGKGDRKWDVTVLLLVVFICALFSLFHKFKTPTFNQLSLLLPIPGSIFPTFVLICPQDVFIYGQVKEFFFTRFYHSSN